VGAGAFAGSIAAHATVLLIALGHAAPATASPAADIDVTLEPVARVVEPITLNALPEPRKEEPTAPEAHPSPSSPAIRPVAYRAPSLGPVPAQPTSSPSADAPQQASPAETSEQGMPSFDLPSGQGAEGAHGAVSASGTGAHPAADDAPVPEQGVSSPARLARGGTPPYPPDGRAQGIEGDVPLELVVSAAGVVESVRVLEAIGYGLDEAAVTAMRAYRFSPALKDGHAVRVRMRWTMQFRIQ
jgi:periplasmic protein TonB